MELFTDQAQTTITAGGTTAPAPGTTETWTAASSAGFAAVTAAAQTTLHVADPLLPSEIIAVTNITGATWTVTRGAGGTTPVAHSASGFVVRQVVTAAVMGTQFTNFAGLFGDGSDGAATLDGTATVPWASKAGSVYTMTADFMGTNLTVNSGVTLNTGGYRIFCAGAFVNNGTVANAGNTATSATGANGSAVGAVGGGNGGGSGTATAGGNAGTTGAGYQNGGAGGTGASGAGGSGGGVLTHSVKQFRLPGYVISDTGNWGTSASALKGAPGGGGGGGDGTSSGGGGGGGGGLVVIVAWSAVNAGTISVAGGNGFTPVAGNCGGGGGGSGGNIIVYTLSAWTAGTTNVAGGTAGSGAGTGTAGTGGGAGNVINAVIQ